MAAADPVATPSTTMTFDEFLAWGDEDTFAEWVDGKVIVFMSAAQWHQRVAAFLASLFQFWVEAHGGGGIVLTAPYLMRLRTRPSGREPDVLYVAPENAGRVGDKYLDGPADIVVEIVSPDSRRRDRQDKFFEYETAGVREYWVYDPDTDEAEFYRLDQTSAFRRIAPDTNGVYESAVLPGFALDTKWLAQRPLPTLVGVLRTWGLV